MSDVRGNIKFSCMNLAVDVRSKIYIAGGRGGTNVHPGLRNKKIKIVYS